MKSAGNVNHIFGPVPSRRLGRSLGVDVVPFKTCTFDCIYCQLGRTTNKTVERREWVPLDAVLDELRGKLSLRPDYITLGGSGEPTLYSRMGELIEGIRRMTDIPIAVLTNGSLLWEPEVRASLWDAQVVVPSLDVGDKALFQAINRPHERCTFDRLVEGLVAFRKEFRGEYWLEVLLLSGYTAFDAEVRKIAEIAREIRPDRVHLNTCVRPPAEDYAYSVDRQRLVELTELFTPPADVVADCDRPAPRDAGTSDRLEIFRLLERRPCTAVDVANGLKMHPAEVVKNIERLIEEGLVEARKTDRERIHYVVTRRTG